jgi:hypothetical protein
MTPSIKWMGGEYFKRDGEKVGNGGWEFHKTTKARQGRAATREIEIESKRETRGRSAYPI